MKLLIVYASAGAGHRRAAEAVFNSLDTSLKKDSRLVDILDFTPPFFKLTYSEGYIFLIRNLPLVWSFFHRLTDAKIFFLVFKLIRRIINYTNTRSFSKFLKENNPQVILSTHFMPSEVTSNLKKRKKINSFLISAITDYAVHSFWLADKIDRYVVGLDCVKEILIRKGVREEKILPLGIPVDKEFLNLKPREEAAKIIGINADKFSALLVTGAIGLNTLGKIASKLANQIQTIVICGKNKRLQERLKQKKEKDLFLFPLVNNMQDFLSCSDIILTKAGGLTISECLVARLPICFICKIGGQEALNIKLMTSLGCAIYEKDLEKVVQKVLDFKTDPGQLMRMRENIVRIAKPDANQEILSLIKEHAK